MRQTIIVIVAVGALASCGQDQPLHEATPAADPAGGTTSESPVDQGSPQQLRPMEEVKADLQQCLDKGQQCAMGCFGGQEMNLIMGLAEACVTEIEACLAGGVTSLTACHTQIAACIDGIRTDVQSIDWADVMGAVVACKSRCSDEIDFCVHAVVGELPSELQPCVLDGVTCVNRCVDVLQGCDVASVVESVAYAQDDIERFLACAVRAYQAQDVDGMTACGRGLVADCSFQVPPCLEDALTCVAPCAEQAMSCVH